MKKLTTIMLLILLIASMLVGCQAASDNSDNKINGNENDTENNENINGDYRTAVTDSSDDADVGGVAVEYVFYDYEGSENVKNKSTTIKIKVNGAEKQLICPPTNASFGGRSYYPVFDFHGVILNKDGMLVGYVDRKALSDDGNENTSKNNWCGEEKAIQVAKDFVSQIVDPSDYEISVEKWDVSSHSYGYGVYFTKYVDGIATLEEMLVHIAYDGTFRSYSADMLCQFSGEEKNPFDMKKAEEAAHARVKEIYGKKMEESDRVELDEEYRLTKLKDGSLAIFYTASIDMIKIDSHGGELYTGARIEMVIMK